MKIKVALVAALSVVGLTAALLWLMDEKVAEEREAALEASLRGSVNVLSQSLQADLRGLRRALPVAGNMARDRMDWKSLKPYFALAQVRFEGGLPIVVQSSVEPKGPAAAWTTQTWSQVLGAWKMAQLPAGGASVRWLSDHNKNRFVGFLLREGDKQWVAMAGSEALQSLIDLQKGPRQTLALIDDQGHLLAHSTNEYAGTAAAKDSVYARILADSSQRGFKNFAQGVSEPAIAAFEKIPRTDLTVMAFRPLSDLAGERRQVLMFGALAAAGLLLVSLSVLWWVLTRWEKHQEILLVAAGHRAASPPRREPRPVLQEEPAANASGGPSPLQGQETAIRIASTLGHELRGPLASILGYCQMVLASTQDPQATAPVDSILRETRSARDVVDRLLAFTGEKQDEKRTTSLELVLAKAMTDFQGKFQQKHVKIRQELHETSPIPLAVEAVEKAIKNVLNNAIEAMNRMNKKEISVRLQETPEAIELHIKDAGEGMEDDIKARALEPFFSTRNPVEHLGLGLAATAGILKEHDGQIRMESTRGKGTTVTMIFPKPVKKVQIFDQKVTLRTEETVSIPQDLPSAPISAKAPEVPSTFRPSVTDLDIEELLSLAEDVTVAPPKPVEKAPEPRKETSKEAGKESLISRPQFKAPERSSNLDGIKVEIRRPGAGL